MITAFEARKMAMELHKDIEPEIEKIFEGIKEAASNGHFMVMFKTTAGKRVQAIQRRLADEGYRCTYQIIPKCPIIEAKLEISW